MPDSTENTNEIQQSAMLSFEEIAERNDMQKRIALRDQFAMTALAGLLASMPPDDTTSISAYATDSYRYADAMLKAREPK